MDIVSGPAASLAEILRGLVTTFGGLTLLLLGAAALVTAAIHGATGIAGGFLMAAILANVIGAKATVPVMSVALLISHSARALLNARGFDARAFWIVSLPAVPAILVVAHLYVGMSPPAVALVLGLVLLVAVAMRRWARVRAIRSGPGLLASAGLGYGVLSGAAIGPGLLLSPFLLGFGLGREAFVATLAVIALMSNALRVGVFGATGLLPPDLAVLALLIGLVTVPGNWIGRTVLRAMSDERHASLVDLFCLVGALNFFWLAFAES